MWPMQEDGDFFFPSPSRRLGLRNGRTGESLQWVWPDGLKLKVSVCIFLKFDSGLKAHRRISARQQLVLVVTSIECHIINETNKLY